MEYNSDSPLYLADQYVKHTNKSIFLTGKAGTGKTTFLKNLKNNIPKRIAIAAPTGVAALNAGGVTLHSLFQLPFGPILPIENNQLLAERKFTNEKIKTLRAIDLLIIDEISMVRADTIDAIDQILRRYRIRSLPFGGVQLLMIGDLSQLSPIVKDEEWTLLNPFYSSMYFFESIALKKSEFITIELTHIFRQKDETFINLLNKIRDNNLDEKSIATLNTRYQPDLKIDEHDEIIHLTTHVSAAHAINVERMQRIKSDPFVFTATIQGEFSESMYPNDERLELKVGAQVMFTRNDVNKLYFNGKIGRIIDINKEDIKVKCKEDHTEIYVKKTDWNNIKYILNEQNQLEEKIIGTFNQYPIKPAWAITIHKSQGLTFDRAIIDAQSSFAHGQVYVALSRCRTFEGLILSTPITSRSVKKDDTIKGFHAQIQNTPVTKDQLESDKRNTQINSILELFDFGRLQNSISYFYKNVLEHRSHVTESTITSLDKILSEFDRTVIQTSAKFQEPLRAYLEESRLAEDNIELNERIKKAASFYISLLQTNSFDSIKNLDIACDNKEIRKSLAQSQDICLRTIFEKISVFKSTIEGFSLQQYIQAKANAAILFEDSKNVKLAKPKFLSNNMPNGKLYAVLKEWRSDMADQLNCEDYMVLTIKSLNEITELLPGNLTALTKIKGIGQKKVEQYGEALIQLVLNYCKQNNLDPWIDNTAIKEKKIKIKGETYLITLQLFKTGLSIAEIAQDRSLAIGTIEMHLAKFVEKGEINAEDCMAKDKLEKLYNLIVDKKLSNSKSIKDLVNNDYSYGEIKIALAGLKIVE